MDIRVEISILLDFYGELLTEKQLRIMQMYFNEDFSLGEISEINQTSRQAIHDLIKRCNKLLSDYEQKLQLAKRNNELRENKEQMLSLLDKLKTKDNSSNDIINKIEKIVIDL